MTASASMTGTEREVYSRARRHFDRGEIDPALEAFSRLLETRENFADIHYMVGVLFDRKGDLDAAAASLRKAIRLNPSYAEALLALATVYERAGDYDRSRELAERAATLSRGEAGVLDRTTRGKLANLQASVGDAYAEAGEQSEAIEAYRKALDRCPDFHDIRHRLGVALRESGLPHKALLEFKRVLRANPKLADTQLQLGLTYYSLGRPAQALEQWQALAARDSEREDVRMYLRMLRGGADAGTAAEANGLAADSENRAPRS